MSAKQETIMAEIAIERARQDAYWGGSTHDDAHTSLAWRALLINHVNRAEHLWAYGSSAAGRKELIQVAALAVAAIEALDRKGETDA